MTLKEILKDIAINGFLASNCDTTEAVNKAHQAILNLVPKKKDEQKWGEGFSEDGCFPIDRAKFDVYNQAIDDVLKALGGGKQ